MTVKPERIMGMFDWVSYKYKCPYCGKAELTEFQSKDRDCQLKTLKPEDVDSFYDKCPKCKKWVEFEVIKEVKFKGIKLKPDKQTFQWELNHLPYRNIPTNFRSTG